MHLPHIPIIVLAALGCAACAGNGDGLDENGRPVDAPIVGGITADLPSIQANVFTPICSVCHAGANAPRGLHLDAANAYSNLVGIASVEVPSLQRVKPGDPNNSYIVHKIEGTATVGGRMPLGQPPLPADTIAAIRQWIALGAPQAVSASLAENNGTLVRAAADGIAVSFAVQLDASLVDNTTVTLQRKTGEAFADVAIRATVNPVNSAVILVSPRAALPAGEYRLQVRGSSGPVAVADIGGQPLGQDYVFEFGLEASR